MFDIFDGVEVAVVVATTAGVVDVVDEEADVAVGVLFSAVVVEVDEAGASTSGFFVAGSIIASGFLTLLVKVGCGCGTRVIKLAGVGPAGIIGAI